MSRRCLATRLVLLLLGSSVIADPAAWRAPGEGYPWSFPEDHRAHEGFRTEWWYLTGILRTGSSPSRRFGYQFTFFRVGLLPSLPTSGSAWTTRDLIMGHAALVDLERGARVFSEVLYRATPFLGGFPSSPDPRLAWSLGPPGTRARWTLSWNGEGFDLSARDETLGLGLELSTLPSRPLVLQGPGGLSRKGEGAGAVSLYYSFPRLDTHGTAELRGEVLPVTGTSWMDKEFSSDSLGKDQVGWDWFGLRLSDGRDLMLYCLRGPGEVPDHARGTVVSPEGTPSYLEREDFSLETLATWRSPATGTAYPARWRIRVPGHGIDLEAIPLVADQENRSQRIPGLDYWEGAVELRNSGGALAGEGFAELTGYGKSRRPGL